MPDQTNEQPTEMEIQLQNEIEAAVRAASTAQPGSLVIRCRVPFLMNAPSGMFRVIERAPTAPSPERPATEDAGEPPSADDANGPAADDDADEDDRAAMMDDDEEDDPECQHTLDVIEGPASSTSVDWYKTRMTRTCLEHMAAQFRRGVDYLPRHHSMFASVEWDDVMGRTVDARVERANVLNPGPEMDGEQYVLYTTTELYSDNPLSRKLVKRIKAGRPPGQSIGGWFTELAVHYDDEGNVKYPVDVLGVDLDHLASVRSPANPDSSKVWLAVQRGIQAGVRSKISGPGASAPTPAPATNGRATPQETTTMTEQELVELVRSAVSGALAPVQAEIEALKARSATPAPETPAAEDPSVSELRSRLAAAEAERDRLASEPVRRASHTPVQAPPPVQDPVSDVRSIAPVFAQWQAATGARVRPKDLPLAVRRHDGLGALVQLAKAQGRADRICHVVEQYSFLVNDPVQLGEPDLTGVESDHGAMAMGSEIRKYAAGRGSGCERAPLVRALADILDAAELDGLLD